MDTNNASPGSHALETQRHQITGLSQFLAMVPFFASPSQPQEENDDADLSDLCQRCREIDLNLIFNRGSRPRRTISSILSSSWHSIHPKLSSLRDTARDYCLRAVGREDLRSLIYNMLDGMEKSLVPSSQTVLCLGQLDGESSCALCRFFASMRRHNPSLQPPTGPYHLRRYDMLCVSGEGWKWDYKQSFPLWAVEQGSGDEFEDHHPGYYTTPRGSIGSWILPTRSTPDPSPFLEALPVIDTSVNYPLLRRWIEGCEGHSICQKTPLDFEPTRGRKRPPIRGINCTTRRIEMIADDDTYLALSYVWGNMSLPAVNGEENNRSLPATAIRVVEDAMMVVKELGHRYLWVDQYCIDQNDEKNKEAQIGNMDQIYERAHATIVAFSGINSSCGLPGVNGSSRIQQYHFNSSKMNLIGLTPGLTAKVAKASVWTQRGWTFQEALLSRRLLIFAQDQAYFLCASGHWAEGCTPGLPGYLDHDPWVYPPDLEPFGCLGNQLLTDSIRPLPRSHNSRYGTKIHMDVEKLLHHIAAYSRRQLGFQADALNAFRGLLSRASILTYWGMPVHELDTESSVPRDTEIASFFFRYFFWNPVPGTASRVNDNAHDRREEFPSWSWLGWRTPVKFDNPGRYVPSFLMETTVQVEEMDGCLISLSDLIIQAVKQEDPSSVIPEKTPYLWLEGPVFTLGFQPSASAGDGDSPSQISFCINHPLGYGDFPCEMKAGCEPRKDRAKLEFWKVETEDDSKLNHIVFRYDVVKCEDTRRSTLNKTWQCLLVHPHHFLILEEAAHGDDVWYCVGTVRFGDTPENRDHEKKLKEAVPWSQKRIKLG